MEANLRNFGFAVLAGLNLHPNQREEDLMGFVPVLNKERSKEPRFSRKPAIPQGERVDWVRLAASGTLILGGCLLLARKRRAGAVAASSAAALALLDHEDTLRRWWQALPGHLDQAQRLLGQWKATLENVIEKGESLRRDLAR